MFRGAAPFGAAPLLLNTAFLRNFAPTKLLSYMCFQRAILFVICIIYAVIPAVADNVDSDRQIMLDEVVVRPKRVKYSKKNNPAVDFVEQVMARRNLTDPRLNNAYYNHGIYERINIGLINPPIDSVGALGFMSEYVDTTELSKRPLLNISVKEKVSDMHYRRDPKTQREVVRLRNRHGLDDKIADAGSMSTIFEEYMRPVDLYDTDDITLLRQKFVSPLGRRATDFYKFYLTDTIADSAHGDSLIVLSFVPHNPATPSFNGKIYVVKGDTTMFIRRAELRMPAETNINFINNFLMVQEYDRAPDGSRLKTRDEIIIEARYIGVDMYASRLSIYNSHSFDEPRDLTVFDHPTEVVERNDLGESIAEFRPANASYGASNMNNMMSRLRTNKAFYNIERVMTALVRNRIRPGGTNGYVSFGPIFSTLNHNDLEGWRVRLGANTTARMSPHWFVSGYGAYGFSDKKWKYSGAVEYSFNKKKDHQGEFPIQSLKVSHTYDVDRLGQHLTSAGTFFNSLTFTQNELMTYKRTTSLSFTWETPNHFSVNIDLSHNQQQPSATVDFIDGTGRRFDNFSQTTATVGLRWAPGEKYYQNIDERIPIKTENPIIALTHTFAPAGVFGTRWGVNKTEFLIEKRWYLSAWGHLDIHLGAGHVWNHTVFTELLMPNANLSYFYQPNAFSLMKSMEFITDTYADLHINYFANGALLNYIPGIKKLKLREIIGFHAVWGQLSERNDPTNNSWLLQFPATAGTQQPNKIPYMEYNVGIGNIARILSVYYVGRLTHNAPGIQRHGIRVDFSFNF